MQPNRATFALTRAKLRSLLGRLRRDHEGVAAVEFAFIVPIMFMMFIGCWEISQAVTIDRRVGQSASSSADLVARAPVAGLTTADVDGLMAIINQLMKPYNVAPLTVKIVSVKSVVASQFVVDWSRDNHGGTPYGRNSAYAGLPVMNPPFLAVGESVIVSEATYHYVPLVISYFVSTYDMSEKFYLKPRNSSCVNLLPISCVTGNVIGK